MKLAAIYNIWCGDELLSGSVDCIKDHVDLIIFVYQVESNFGEFHNPFDTISQVCKGLPFTVIQKYIPDLSKGGTQNEISKRNIGIDIAAKLDCTHFIHLDCDEYWEDFEAAKNQFISSGAVSSVAQMWTYFKKPTLRFVHSEPYFVPFITKLEKGIAVGSYTYPYYCDPTRKPGFPVFKSVYNKFNTIVISQKMHHYSYVRKDILRKIRNSSAKKNIEKSNILEDYFKELSEGSYIGFFRQKLIEVDNQFNICL
jgi:hypothetical protein